ncbi:MAG: type II toxin-antitoxin system HicA family toxin [Xanthomonadaceae bacterium]|nr:type II toxin-antitoxin system HicA family toxin [Xanthomonadaceae bacterium]MDE1885748.1 type II toxin-antitoxin system HicA family toxin [Xanthomonadaceae bacterium]MDE1960809.1 type II toxin-antitoxin system HicA family toxin [Xanthomonadaceae bacterium]MDE2083849.1 type II toxin-antitoxin system HicA family toxin [Xanthomonadaceae bacterium]MDE2256324.1 type II toxin-antitoxin system HicA family toxin [Xanthomonadaceae bacterium]
MKRKHAKTLALLFKHPVSGSVRFDDALALLRELGASVETNREGSRIAVVLFGQVRVLHKPHPSPTMGKGAVASLRDWLEINGVRP